MQLIYTPRSHYARKVRLLMAGLGLEAELVDAGNVALAEAAFGPNPLMKVPTLVDGGQVLFESDHIAAWLVRRHDPHDRFDVLTTDADALNARAVLNGVMQQEVEIVLGARSGLDTAAHPRFIKMRAALERGLDWLEARAGLFSGSPDYLGLHLVCLWDHLLVCGLMPDRGFPRLRERVCGYSALPWVSASKPG